MTHRTRTVLLSLLVGAPLSAAQAQSLYRTGGAPATGAPGAAAPDPAAAAYPVSLMALKPPEPRGYAIHDQVTIIINESSRQESDQSLDTKKDSSIEANLNAALDPKTLLEAELSPADTMNLTLIDADAKSQFKGEGEYERNDRFTDRLTAVVIDVKPNGILVLEAKRIIRTDDEVKTLVLSGNCRTEDVSVQGTVQSNQLANLTLAVRHEGRIRDAAKKGWLTRALETAFPF